MKPSENREPLRGADAARTSGPACLRAIAGTEQSGRSISSAISIAWRDYIRAPSIRSPTVWPTKHSLAGPRAGCWPSSKPLIDRFQKQKPSASARGPQAHSQRSPDPSRRRTRPAPSVDAYHTAFPDYAPAPSAISKMARWSSRAKSFWASEVIRRDPRSRRKSKSA